MAGGNTDDDDKRGSIFRIKPSSIFHDPFGISVIGESNQSMKYDTCRLKSFSKLKKSFEKECDVIDIFGNPIIQDLR